MIKILTEQNVALVAREVLDGKKYTAFADMYHPSEIIFHPAYDVVQFRDVVVGAFGPIGLSQFARCSEAEISVHRADFSVTVGAEETQKTKVFSVLDFPKPWPVDFMAQLSAVKILLSNGADFSAAKKYIDRISTYFLGTTKIDPVTGGYAMVIRIPTQETTLRPSVEPIQVVALQATLSEAGDLEYSWNIENL